VKVIIVDDELLVRTGIQGLIDWEAHGYQLVGEARTGREALELIRRVAPVIVISDIMMPELTGLELMEQVRKEGIEAEFILLTSHRDFQFAKKALELEALEYLVKHDLLADQLLSGLEKAKGKFAIRKSNHLGHPVTHETHSYVIAFHVHWIGKVMHGRTSFPLTQVTGVIRQVVSPQYTVSLLHQDKAVFLFLLSGDSDLTSQAARSLLDRIAHQIKLIMNLELRINLYPFVSTSVDHWLRLLNSSFIKGACWILDSTDQQSNLSQSENIHLPSEQFSSHIGLPEDLLTNTGDYAKSKMDQWFTGMKDAGVLGSDLCSGCVRFLDGLISKTQSQGKRTALELIREEVSQASLIFRVYLGMKEALDLFFRDQTPSVQLPSDIISIQEYIDQHYSEVLGLDHLAQLANKSPSYFSTYFHTHVGVPLIDYINRIRVDKACKYLETTDEPIKSVGFACGFGNEKYFSRIFKNLTGIPPGEYRSKKKIPPSTE
jgi:two-component system response regulator YesN